MGACFYAIPRHIALFFVVFVLQLTLTVDEFFRSLAGPCTGSFFMIRIGAFALMGILACVQQARRDWKRNPSSTGNNAKACRRSEPEGSQF